MNPTETKETEAKTPEKPKAQETKPAVEKQANCLSCNKPIRKLKRYYRNGKFYCNKICWRNYTKKQDDKTTKA